MLAEFDKDVDVGTADVAAVSEVRHRAISNIAASVFTYCFIDEDIFDRFHYIRYFKNVIYSTFTKLCLLSLTFSPSHPLTF